MPTGQITDAVTGHGGWIRFAVDGIPGDVFVRFQAEAGGRLRAVSVVLESSGTAVQAAHLRALPLARLEAYANADRRTVEANLKPEVDVAGLLRGARGGMGGEAVRTVPPARPRKPRPLRVPDASPYPDGFYARVAAHYRWWAAREPRPALRIAEAAGVPVSTAHRWTREARRRGHLPPARRGAAG